MEYVYAALILNETGEEINEDNVTGVLEAAGVDVEESRVKALVAALEDVDIEEAIETAAAAAAAAPPRALRGRRGRRRGRRRERRRGRRRRGSGGRRGRGRRRRRGPRRALRLTPDDSRDFDRVDRLSNIRFLLNFAIRSDNVVHEFIYRSRKRRGDEDRRRRQGRVRSVRVGVPDRGCLAAREGDEPRLRASAVRGVSGCRRSAEGYTLRRDISHLAG